MKKVCVLTATRAEYGILYPVIKEIDANKNFELQLIVSGTHLSNEFGNTKSEIQADGFWNFKEIEIISSSKKIGGGISAIMSVAIAKFAGYLKHYRPDIAIILGDRYEMLAFAIALVNEKIPIAHISGGETTVGVLDELYRHAITKMSALHFTNCDVHRKRVIQMGESPDRVFNVGDTCVDNIRSTKFLTKEQLEYELGFEIKRKLILVTFHPETLEKNTIDHLKYMLAVISNNDKYQYLFTMANADEGGRQINKVIFDFVKSRNNCRAIESLGRIRYLSILNYAIGVMGNSSSGLYEVPYFRIPTINIGNRQKQRIHGDTVIDCDSSVSSITDAFNKAFSEEFIDSCKIANNLFGDGHAAEKIVDIIGKKLEAGIKVEKFFFDIDFSL